MLLVELRMLQSFVCVHQIDVCQTAKRSTDCFEYCMKYSSLMY